MTSHRHFIIHKPYRCLSQFVNNQTRRRNKKLLGDLADFPQGTMAIGRLDEKSEGLLLLTTDGTVSEAVRSKNVEKEYAVQVDGLLTQEAIAHLRSGVVITVDGKPYETIPCKVECFDFFQYFDEDPKEIRSDRHGPNSWLSITLTEGKFRQVRKMTAAVGFPTLRLIRIRIGSISIKNRVAGHVEEVKEFQVRA
jgi:23S rRNA pseudouridine2457 synthase